MSDYRLEYVKPWLHIHGPKFHVATKNLLATHTKKDQVIKLVPDGPNEVIDQGDLYTAKDFELYVFVSSTEDHESYAWLKCGAARLFLPMDVAHLIVQYLAVRSE